MVEHVKVASKSGNFYSENQKERLATQSKNQQGLECLAGGSRAAIMPISRPRFRGRFWFSCVGEESRMAAGGLRSPKPACQIILTDLTP